MRVLVTSTPGTGHVLPMIPTASALRDAGHTLVWATGRETCRELSALGFDTVVCGLSVAERKEIVAPHRARFAATPAPQRRAVMGSVIFGEVSAAPMLADLEPIAAEGAFDLVLHEPLELAAPIVARSLGIPHVVQGFGALIPPAVVDAITEVVAPLWNERGLDVPDDLGQLDDLFLCPFPPSFASLPDDGRARRVRPVSPTTSQSTPPEWLHALGRERPLVYATYGTEPAPDKPFERTIEALAALDVDGLLTVGPHTDPASFGAVADNVRVERFTPQSAVLDRAAVVVSHAGSGTLLGAATAGVPQVLLPMGADQFENAAAAEHAGVAIRGESAETSADGLRNLVLRQLEDAEARAAAARVAAEIAEMPSPTELVPIVEQLA
jgi:UDP:flavonoid glycosyltransferase YjiC (YdhE family)